MTYEELLISIDLNGCENVLPTIGKKCLDNHWFIVCDDGDCHLFDRYGKEDDISKIKEMNKNIISKNIKKIVIPNNVTSIKQYAFSWCRLLTSVTIPNGVTSIGNWAFYNCNSLMNMIILNSVMSIEDYAFAYCNGLESMIIPNSVTSIGDGAFRYCSSLIDIMIPNNVTSIGEQAFRDCSNLKSLIFKGKTIKQVKSMKNYPFGIEDESIIKCIY